MRVNSNPHCVVQFCSPTQPTQLRNFHLNYAKSSPLNWTKSAHWRPERVVHPTRLLVGFQWRPEKRNEIDGDWNEPGSAPRMKPTDSTTGRPVVVQTSSLTIHGRNTFQIHWTPVPIPNSVGKLWTIFFIQNQLQTLQQTLTVLHLPHFWTFLLPKLIIWKKQLYLGSPSSTYHYHCPIPPTLVNVSQSWPPLHPLKFQSFYTPPSPNLPTLTSFPPPWLNCVLPPFHHSLLIWQIFLSCMVFFHPALRLPRSPHFSKNQNWTQMNFQITGRFPISTISRNSLNVSFWLGFNLTSSTLPITTHSSPLTGLATQLKLLYSPY